jgi:two-component system LytT family sensor kinase
LVREGFGIGLRNVRERIQVLYGDDATVEMVSRPGRGTRVRLSVPVMAGDRDESWKQRATAGMR